MTPERGSTPVELALGVGVLVVPIVLVLAAIPPLVEHRSVARLAAAEALRSSKSFLAGKPFWSILSTQLV